MMRLLVATLVLACALPESDAEACGGLVQGESGSVAQDGQLSVLSIVDDHTDVILTLDVPDASNAFGVIVPVPEEPVIDAEPVSTDALTALDESTRPTFFVESDGSAWLFYSEEDPRAIVARRLFASKAGDGCASCSDTIVESPVVVLRPGVELPI